MTVDYPRVLFVTPHAFNKVTGGGITFTNLFQGWPMDRIATVHNDPEPTTGDVCERFFVLGRKELDYAWPFSALSRLAGRPSTLGGPSGPTAAPMMENAASRTPAASMQQRSKSATRLAALKRYALALLGDGLPERARLSPPLEEWIAAYRPDVLYTILGSNGMMRLIDAVRRRFDLPTIVHVMDDWMSANHRHGLLSSPLRWEMERLVASAIAAARVRLGISSAMCRAFEARYGYSFEAFHNAIDTERWARLAKRDVAVGASADILYVGSIFPRAQLDALSACCRAAAALASGGFPVTLTISAPSGHAECYRDRLAIDPAIRIVDTIRDDETFFRRIAQADLLLLPVNFDEDSVRFIRYSMPTKVPAYLVAGAPILAYGPLEAAQIAYAAEEGWAIVRSEPDLDGLTAAIRQALTDLEARRRVLAAARAAAARNHDAVRVRARFQARIAAAARSASA